MAPSPFPWAGPGLYAFYLIRNKKSLSTKEKVIDANILKTQERIQKILGLKVNILNKKGLIPSKFGEKNNLFDLRSLDSFALMSGIDKGEFWSSQRDLARIISDNVVIPEEGILETLKDASRHANVPIILGINKDENKVFIFNYF